MCTIDMLSSFEYPERLTSEATFNMSEFAYEALVFSELPSDLQIETVDQNFSASSDSEMDDSLEDLLIGCEMDPFALDPPFIEKASICALIDQSRDESHFNCDYLRDEARFFSKLMVDINEHEQQQLIRFHQDLHSNRLSVSARLLHKITKRTFGKDYLKDTKMKKPEIRKRCNLLEKKFYAIVARYLLLTKNYAITVQSFVDLFYSIIEQFPSYRVMETEGELELLFRCLAPTLIFETEEFNGAFYHRKSTLLLELGEFMEYSDRQYNSGGGKTASTRLRESCLDLITGNVRSTRNRISRKAGGKRSKGKAL